MHIIFIRYTWNTWNFKIHGRNLNSIDLKVIDDDPKPKIINMVMAGIKQHTKLG